MTPPRILAAVAWPKACGCGARYSREEWEALRTLGVQRDRDGNPEIELRNCAACGSTLAVPVAG